MQTIYSISDPVTLAVFYVGQTKDIKKRTYQHLRQSHNPKVMAAIEKIKAEGREPVFTVIEDVADGFSDREKHWILHFKSRGYELLNTNVYYDKAVLSVQVEKKYRDRLIEFAAHYGISQAKMIELIIDSWELKSKPAGIPMLQTPPKAVVSKKESTTVCAGKCQVAECLNPLHRDSEKYCNKHILNDIKTSVAK